LVRRLVASVVLFAVGVVSVSAAYAAPGPDENPLTQTELRERLGRVAEQYPGAFFAAVYSMDELRPAFLEVVDQGVPDPWDHRSVNAFERGTSAWQKESVVYAVSRDLSAFDRAKQEVAIAKIHGWCEADAIIAKSARHCFERLFGAFLVADGTRGIFDEMPESRKSSPEPLSESLAAAERSEYYKEALTRIAALPSSERFRCFAQIFEYLAENCWGGWGFKEER